ncbi:hypothetical protein GALMADRAFT_146443 [Galerina marginata CBS 339.88]|uniref:Uncharacterized protein n=1 Tax=Galerina marginata (strain CBS 339.88) TaxID=685588 RepID=A0A067SKD7_GALM3|nr:hypothetical protein GALMADRAFT_146443 [Galerina marginata CBS 339.88]
MASVAEQNLCLFTPRGVTILGQDPIYRSPFIRGQLRRFFLHPPLLRPPSSPASLARFSRPPTLSQPTSNMPNTRVFIAPSAITTTVELRSRIYPSVIQDTRGASPRQVIVPTRQAGGPTGYLQRYPLVESVMRDPHSAVQSTDVLVVDMSSQKMTKFTVFYKKGHYLPRSECLKVLLFGSANASQLGSDIVVMRKGSMGNYINFGNKDNLLADWLVPRFAKHPSINVPVAALPDLVIIHKP